MTNPKLTVKSVGVITPVGMSVAGFWDSLIKGKSGLGRITRFDVSQYVTQIGGELKNFNPEEFGIDKKKARRIDPFVQYALAATKEAYETSGLDIAKYDPYRFGVIVGSGIGGMLTIEEEHKKLL